MELDARKKACPQPVVLSLQALGKLPEEEVLEVLVDNDTAVENLKRMAEKKELSFAVATENAAGGSYFRVSLRKQGAGAATQDAASMEEELTKIGVSCAANPSPENKGPARSTVVIGTDQMGQGDEKLGRILMKSYLYALNQTEPFPETVILFNGGAKLAVAGTETAEDLKALEDAGVEIVVCGTCADYYGIKEQLAAGHVSNMYDIATAMAEARHLIRI